MPKEVLEKVALSPYLKSVLENFEELSCFYGEVQIIQDLIALQVEQKTTPFYPHLSPLEKYCPEEAEALLHIFDMLQTEIEEQIKAIETKKKTYALSELHLTYSNPTKLSDRPIIRSSEDAYRYLLYNWSEQIEYVEEFNILLLNTANHILGIYQVSKGGRTQTLVDNQVVFAAALKANASSIILAHNHPSGNLRPSQADLNCTERLQKGAALLGLTIADHLIITSGGYFSFADEGLLMQGEIVEDATVVEPDEVDLPF